MGALGIDAHLSNSFGDDVADVAWSESIPSAPTRLSGTIHSAMRKLLVFQHVPFEPLGTLDRQFKDAGFRIRYVNFFRQSEVRVKVGRYHGLVVLGGPMSADQTQRYPHLNFELESISKRIAL